MVCHAIMCDCSSMCDFGKHVCHGNMCDADNMRDVVVNVCVMAAVAMCAFSKTWVPWPGSTQPAACDMASDGMQSERRGGEVAYRQFSLEFELLTLNPQGCSTLNQGTSVSTPLGLLDLSERMCRKDQRSHVVSSHTRLQQAVQPAVAVDSV